MPSYTRLLISVVLFIGAWFCLLSAAVHVPANPKDLSDTAGLSPAVIYTVALEAIGFVAIVFVGLGMLFSKILKSHSFGMKLVIFCSSNLLLLLSSLLGIFVNVSYVPDTIPGVASISLYIGVIGLVTTAAPKRT
ncbi:hypothetical protein ACYZT7_29855 [Pseudomonas sp. RT4P38]